MKYIIGITGGSGSGKTTVSDAFRKKGAEIVDGDKVARIIMEPGQKCLEETVLAFGDGILDEDGKLKRKELAKIVFSNSEKLEILNKITHKYITEYFLDRVKNSPADIVGIDGAVLFESGIDKLCDALIGVVSDEEIRVQRIVKRDGISELEARMRIKSQKNNQFYIENCDYLVYNNSEEEKIPEIIEEVLGKLASEKERKKRKHI